MVLLAKAPGMAGVPTQMPMGAPIVQAQVVQAQPVQAQVVQGPIIKNLLPVWWLVGWGRYYLC